MESYCFCLEDLFYYLITTLRSENIKINKLTYKEMKEYGNLVIEEAKKKGINAYMYLNRELTSHCLGEHQRFIKEDSMYSVYTGLKMARRYKQDEMDDEFRCFMPLDLSEIIFDKKFVEKIVEKFKAEHGMTKSKDRRIYFDKAYFFGIRDLFFNLLITLKEAGISVDSLTYSECEDYGSILEENAKKSNINLILSLFKSKTKTFYEDYFEYVEEIDDGIRLKKDLNVPELIELCRGYLACDMLKLVVKPSVKNEVINYYAEHHNLNIEKGRSRKRNRG